VGRSDPRPSLRRLFVLGVVVALFGGGGVAPGLAYPTVPVGLDSGFLHDLAAPVLAPGGTGTITLTVGNPLAGTISAVVASIGLYAFNAYPGNATGGLPTDSPTLTYQGRTGATATLDVGDLASGGAATFDIAVAAPTDCPSGAFAVRTSVDFTSNGTAYRLASRGFFSDALWAQATAGPNRTSVLNLTVLGVSGVVPETGVLVRANPYPSVLYVVLAAALVLAAAGGYYAWRRGPSSSSGARSPDPPSQADSAFGKSRTRDGDWRSS